MDLAFQELTKLNSDVQKSMNKLLLEIEKKVILQRLTAIQKKIENENYSPSSNATTDCENAMNIEEIVTVYTKFKEDIEAFINGISDAQKNIGKDVKVQNLSQDDVKKALVDALKTVRLEKGTDKDEKKVTKDKPLKSILKTNTEKNSVLKEIQIQAEPVGWKKIILKNLPAYRPDDILKELKSQGLLVSEVKAIYTKNNNYKNPLHVVTISSSQKMKRVKKVSVVFGSLVTWEEYKE